MKFDYENIFSQLREFVEEFKKKSIEKVDRENLSILDIGPENNAIKNSFSKAKVYTLDKVNKGDYSNIDICREKASTLKRKFHAVFLTEVLEHTDDPWKAIEFVSECLEPKGLLFLSVPFIIWEHAPPPDNWRFTTQGLKLLLKDYFDIKEVSIKMYEETIPIDICLVAEKK